MLGSVWSQWWRQKAPGLNADVASALSGAYILPENHTSLSLALQCAIGEVEAYLQNPFLGKTGISPVVPTVFDTDLPDIMPAGKKRKLVRMGKQRIGPCGSES